MPAEPLSVDAALAEFCLHMGDLILAADRVERSMFGRPLLNGTELHAIKGMTAAAVRTHWTQFAGAMALLSLTVKDVGDSL